MFCVWVMWVQVLEIQGNEVRVVKANQSADVNARSRL